MDDVVTWPDDMQPELIDAGTDAIAASEFADQIFGIQHATRFEDVYGKEGWVAEAIHGRKSMQPWNCNDRAGRRL